MPEFDLYLITCSHEALATTVALEELGQTSLVSDKGTWLLAIDSEKADAEDLHAGVILEGLLDVLGEDISISVVEVNNIATYNIVEAGEQMLDALFPTDEPDQEEE